LVAEDGALRNVEGVGDRLMDKEEKDQQEDPGAHPPEQAANHALTR
jgi:hypothetical protein